MNILGMSPEPESTWNWELFLTSSLMITAGYVVCFFAVWGIIKVKEHVRAKREAEERRRREVWNGYLRRKGIGPPPAKSTVIRKVPKD